VESAANLGGLRYPTHFSSLDHCCQAKYFSTSATRGQPEQDRTFLPFFDGNLRNPKELYLLFLLISKRRVSIFIIMSIGIAAATAAGAGAGAGAGPSPDQFAPNSTTTTTTQPRTIQRRKNGTTPPPFPFPHPPLPQSLSNTLSHRKNMASPQIRLSTHRGPN
jgi:hypothetical protein